MKLKELFDKYTLDEILPFLKAIEPERGDSLYQFREALDLLKRMEPSKEDCGEVRIEWSQDEYDEDRYISVHPLEGVCWDAGLAKEVVVSEELHLDEKDVAAHCLWSITFWGSKMSLTLKMEALSNIPQSKETNMTKHSIEFSLAIGSIPPLADIDPKPSHSVLMLISV